jgi:hypothetical protein
MRTLRLLLLLAAWLPPAVLDTASPRPLFLRASPPVVVGRSDTPGAARGSELLDPSLCVLPVPPLAQPLSQQPRRPALLVTASSALSRNQSRSFISMDGGNSWNAELNGGAAGSTTGDAAALSCLPPAAAGTLCFSSGGAVELDPARTSSLQHGLLRSVMLLLDASSGQVHVVKHRPATLDMTASLRNMTLGRGNLNATSFTLSAGPAVSDGSGGLLLTLIGQFEGLAPPPAPPKTRQAPATSLVVIATRDGGSTWAFRSMLPLNATANSVAAVAAPACTPACPLPAVCQEVSPHTFACVCKPECKKTSQVCEAGVCVPTPPTRYITATPPVVVGQGSPNGSLGLQLIEPHVHLLARNTSLPGGLAVVVSGRTGTAVNPSRYFALRTAEKWEEIKWGAVASGDGTLGIPPVCISGDWGNRSEGVAFCMGRQLDRPSTVESSPLRCNPNTKPAEECPGGALCPRCRQKTCLCPESTTLDGPRLAILRGSTFTLTPGGAAQSTAVNVSLNFSAAHNLSIAAGKSGGSNRYSASAVGRPALMSSNETTLMQLLLVQWQIDLGQCLGAMDHYCISSRMHSPDKCAACLNARAVEIVQAGCNDTNIATYCAGPPPAYEGQEHLVVVASTNQGRSWEFHAEVPLLAPNATAEQFSCAQTPTDAGIVTVDSMQFVVWQPTQINGEPFKGNMCGSLSQDGGLTWRALHQLHGRVDASGLPVDGAPPRIAGIAPRLSSLGHLGGLAMLTGRCGPGHSHTGYPGAGLWLWTGMEPFSASGIDFEAYNLAAAHNAGLPSSSKEHALAYTTDFVAGVADAGQSSGVTDVTLLRSNSTHAELLVVYDRLAPGRTWNGSATTVFAMQLTISAVAPPPQPCKPACKKGYACRHATPTSKGVCQAPKVCKPACKKPKTCDGLTGKCVLPPPPPPQSCLGPVSASMVQLNSTTLLAVWQPWNDKAVYGSSQCMAVSHTGGLTWITMGTVKPSKSTSGIVASFGVSPKLAWAPQPFGTPPGGFALMAVGRAGKGYGDGGYPGSGLQLWASSLDTSSPVTTDDSLRSAWTSLNLAEAHNDGIAPNETDLTFTESFVDGTDNNWESSGILDLMHLSSNTTHAEFLVVYDRQKGNFKPDFHRFDPTRPNWRSVANRSTVFAMRISASTVPPEPPPFPKNQLQYLTYYDVDAAAVNLTGANLIWGRGSNVTALNDAAGQLGVKAMWAFVGECGLSTKCYQEPYCGADRPHQKGPTHGLSGNWSLHVSAVANQMVGQSNVVGMWMGDGESAQIPAPVS